MTNRRIDESYAGYRLQIGAHEHAKQAAVRDTISAEFLSKLGLSNLLGEAARNRRKRILEQFEHAGRQIRRQAFIDLVACFEADLFRLVRMASSKVRHVLDENYDSAYPFFDHRQDMARTSEDFANLGGYKRLLAKTSASAIDPRRDLWEVIAYRDFLAHGERWPGPAVSPTVDGAYEVLSGELARVEAKR